MSAVRSRQHPPAAHSRASTHDSGDAARAEPNNAASGVVVQLVRIPACHAGGRGFESRPLRQHCRGANASSPFFAITGVANTLALPSGHVRSRPQAQAHRAGHPGADHAAVRVLRRRLLLSPGRHRPRRSRPSAATRSRRRNSTRCCASSRNGCARRSAATSIRRCSTRPRCATRWSTSSSTSGCSRSRARADRFRVSDTQLQQFIAGLPPFQEDGKFSADKYRAGACGAGHVAAACSSSACAASWCSRRCRIRS